VQSVRFQQAFGQSLDEAERQWREWLSANQTFASRARR
jgi:hypothetical protein